ncbi:hypothetical protein H920_01350 [Fukomys damarensis]|uniref:Uncharacterized protein n=1 Tax=Fukomys damarensis TaxID=885580 RepID=A0A091ENM7_FUKDA|nr:hypothetical protein H920_01350 [Fukomys damarensis]
MAVTSWNLQKMFGFSEPRQKELLKVPVLQSLYISFSAIFFACSLLSTEYYCAQYFFMFFGHHGLFIAKRLWRNGKYGATLGKDGVPFHCVGGLGGQRIRLKRVRMRLIDCDSVGVGGQTVKAVSAKKRKLQAVPCGRARFQIAEIKHQLLQHKFKRGNILFTL